MEIIIEDEGFHLTTPLAVEHEVLKKPACNCALGA